MELYLATVEIVEVRNHEWHWWEHETQQNRIVGVYDNEAEALEIAEKLVKEWYSLKDEEDKGYEAFANVRRIRLNKRIDL